MQWWELSKVALLLDYWDCFQGNIKQHLFNNPLLKCIARKKKHLSDERLYDYYTLHVST